MAVEIQKESGGKLMTVRVSGKLTKEDYDRFVPEIEQAIERFGKIRFLLEMRDFHGWQAAALWEDIKFDAKHFADIERLALVGDKKWEKGMGTFCEPFTTAKIKYFDLTQVEQAREWITAGLEAPVS
ncbi:MAG: STAS/SEC14 domain-containing protein [Sedimentisphaerales bacterium]|nr:STAS/SEC14 domain-containing protein [Sedimentisphaerales bacterium]